MGDLLFTVGHSHHAMEVFLALLQRHGVTLVADVRSHPFSRHVPHFSHAPLQQALAEAGVVHLFLGRELGARRPVGAGEGAWDERDPLFLAGLAGVRSAMERHTVALLCAEGDPLICHRGLWVGAALAGQGVDVAHILPDGGIMDQRVWEDRLLELHHLPERDLFHDRAALVAEARARQWARLAGRGGGEHRVGEAFGG